MVEELRIMKGNQLGENGKVLCSERNERGREKVPNGRRDDCYCVLLTLHHWRVVLEEELVEVLVNEGTEASTCQCCMQEVTWSQHDCHMTENHTHIKFDYTYLHCWNWGLEMEHIMSPDLHQKVSMNINFCSTPCPTPSYLASRLAGGERWPTTWGLVWTCDVPHRRRGACRTGDSEGCQRRSDDQCLWASPYRCQNTPSEGHPGERYMYRYYYINLGREELRSIEHCQVQYHSNNNILINGDFN